MSNNKNIKKIGERKKMGSGASTQHGTIVTNEMDSQIAPDIIYSEDISEISVSLYLIFRGSNVSHDEHPFEFQFRI